MTRRNTNNIYPGDFRQNKPVTDELLASLERRYAASIRKAQRDAARADLLAKWRYKNEGTAETHEAIDRVPSRRRQSPLDRMFKLGKLSADELAAANEIAAVVEMIERAVTVRCASLETRVDCSGSGTDVLAESLGRVRLEIAYRVWRDRIPAPRRMIIDMLTSNQPYVALARRYRTNWRTARKRLLTALRIWPEVRLVSRYMVKAEDLNAAYARLGDGVMLPPRPRHAPYSLAEAVNG